MSTLTAERAGRLARDWIAQRPAVRKALVAAARAANPRPHPEWPARQVPEGAWPSQEIRKLYQYPGDLSEQRLMELAGL